MLTFDALLPWLLPFAAVGIGLGLGLLLVRLSIRSRTVHGNTRRMIWRLVLLLTALILIPMLLPLGNELRGQLLSLLGLLLSAVLGLSSTTLIANAMAGFMQRSISSFEPGDFISVGDTFGRVTERALLHTELQTEDRDLVTLPNVYLLNHPVKVVHGTGTLIGGSVSLGYDVPRKDVEQALLAAAEAAGLGDSFVQVLELGDFSVVYRVAGFLEDVRRLVSKRSELKACMLDQLHGAGIEIVSPNFMNQRQLDPGQPVIPPQRAQQEPAGAGVDAERVMFDKADLAARLAHFVKQRDELLEQIRVLSESTEKDDPELELRRRELNFIEQVLASLQPGEGS
ncbi:MAG: mechanosensitive ion channel family protein [Pseudomonadota bacterium]